MNMKHIYYFRFFSNVPSGSFQWVRESVRALVRLLSSQEQLISYSLCASVCMFNEHEYIKHTNV